MSDIVFRLRALPEASDQHAIESNIFTEAADEIERLRLLQYDIKINYRDFIETLAWTGIFKDAKILVEDIESGKFKDTLESQLKHQIYKD